MSFVDLSGYKSTKAPEGEIELLDFHGGGSKTILNLGSGTDRLLLGFLKGRIRLETIPGRVDLDVGRNRQDLVDLGLAIESE